MPSPQTVANHNIAIKSRVRADDCIIADGRTVKWIILKFNVLSTDFTKNPVGGIPNDGILQDNSIFTDPAFPVDSAGFMNMVIALIY
jgi:hypothetical protein